MSSVTPNGCAHGKDKRDHAIEHYGGVGFHVYAAPDTETIKARMLARRGASDER